jgi:cephalosporin-C deacetylase-like acetyl esterase
MHFHLAVLLRKHILLSTFAATFALAGCGSKGNASDGVATDPRGVHACQPAADSAALTDAMVAQCDDGRPKPPVYVPNLTGPAQGFPGRTCSVDHFTQNGSATSKKLDLLLVLDTTTRISHAWTELAEHLDRLTTRLDGVDLRIAIVLAHVDEQEGRLWAPGAEPRVLDLRKMSVREASARLKGYLWSAVNAFEDRGIGEAAFYSLHQLVTKHAEEARRQGFFRPDAGLAVLFQSDEQEIGANVPSPLPDGVRPRCDDDYPPVIQREFYRPQDLNASSVFAAVRALKGAMPVSMNAFVNVNSEDMEHYLPVFQHPSDGKLCVYASPGYGYFEMVAKTGGALRSVHEPAELKLDHLGVSLRDGLALQHDFPLSHPAREVDPVTIQSTVDGGLTPHTYSATTNIAHLDYAGRAGSKIDISYCQPQDQTNWSISGFAGQTTQTSATLSWQTTGAATTGVVRWGTSPNQLTQAVPDDGTGSSHSVTVTGLRPGTTYYFQAVATDDYGLSKTSPVISLSTQAPSLPSWTLTGFAGVGAQISVQLSFATSEYATTGKVLWGTSQRGLDHSTPADVSPVTAHSFTVSGLQPDTTYYFQAVASDDRGQTKQSAVIAVKTQAVPLPSWTLANFAGTSTRTSVTLSFATTEYATTGKVLWGTSQRGLDQSTPTDASPTTAHTFTVTGLNPNTTYYFQAVATDDRGQTKSSAVIAVKTQALPSWSIEGFAGVATQTSVTLSFTTSTYATTGKVFWGTSQGGLD